jgi:signal transduction histidine kinase
VLIALVLIALCVFTAVSLFHQQATVARVLHETMTSRRAAVKLEECLTDLITLENEQVGAVAPLHDRVREHLVKIQEASDTPEEQQLAAQLHRSFAEYLKHWQALPPPGTSGRPQAFRNTTRFLEAEVLRPCQEFRQLNEQRLDDTTQEHELILRQLSWGMGLIGGLGGGAGLLLGFGVARGLALSIRRLRVQVRGAVGKLGPDLPEIVLTGEGVFGGLHEDLDLLTARIEDVVRQLQQRDREVLRAEQLAAVGQLAAGVGHEVRNPLTSIKMLVQAGLEDGDRPGLTPEDLRIIVSEIRRVERSLQTFLDFARPPKPERRPVDLLPVVDTVLGLVRGRAEKQRVVTQVSAPPGGVTLTADAGQLQQVMINLVLNALDAMPTGGILSVLIRNAPDHIEVEVTDTGPGVPKDMVPRLFQPFASSKETGLGLGLVISRRIVEDHKGAIEAMNRPGGGASVLISLPIRAA